MWRDNANETTTQQSPNEWDRELGLEKAKCQKV